MKIFITGIKGFVGTETAKLLLENGHEVVGFDLMDNQDIRDKEQLEKAINETKPDRILHLAAIARFSDADKDPKLAFETNVEGTRNIAEIAKELHIPIVYSSTGSVYMPISKTPPITEEFPGCGNSVYGCTKYAGELYIKNCSPYIILRYAHIFGKEKIYGLVGSFIERIKRGMAPILYGGKQSNDFTYIKDVAKANLLALTAAWDKFNQIYNVGTGEEISAEDAGKKICEITKYKGKIDIQENRTVDPEKFIYDISKAKNMLGFEAEFSFEEGLKDMFADVPEEKEEPQNE